MSLGPQVFQNLESFSFPPPPLSHPIPPTDFSSFAFQQNDEDHLVADASHVLSAGSELETLSLAGSLCLLCKGKKYGFTAYFHNHKIFPEPPHEILPLVEESYMLRDRLKSLLVTYAMRGVEQDEVESVMTQVYHWEFSVGALTDEVMTSASNAGFVLNLGRLDDVRKWKDTIVDELKYYVLGQGQGRMERARLAALMLEYRKVWEPVWIGYLQDHKGMHSETCTGSYTFCM